MRLDVPLIRQYVNTNDCGLAGIAMLLKYYNINISYKKLKELIDVDSVGTYAPQLGSFLIKHGFQPTIITMQPFLFTKKSEKFSRDDLIEEVSNFKVKNRRIKKAKKYFVDFLRDGGNLIVKVPVIEDIINEIKEKRPVCALMTTNFMNNNTPIFNFHFNIVTGFDRKYVYTNDPLWDRRGGRKKYLIQDFFYGLYASAFGDIDNASLMLVRKK